MKINNQNLPPVPTPPNSKIPIPPAFPPLPPQSPLPPKPPIPPLPPEKIEEVNFIDPTISGNNNKKIIIWSVVLILSVLAVYGIYAAAALRKDVKNIKVSGSQVNFTWQGNDISAQLGSKETLSFFTNGGGLYSRNSANFAVIPMDKIRYLKQKYSDFTHCGSPGEAEAKSSSFPVELIANNANVERNLGKLEELVKKNNLVVFEIDGSPLQQMQISQAGKNMSMGSNMVFYLIDDVRIVQEKYQ
jgi:hypothetical protein